MNAPIKTFRVRPAVSFAGVLLLLSTLVSVGGCADLRRATSLPPVNPESPVAPAVAAAMSRSFVQPRLSDVPPAPKNIPSAANVKLGVVQLVGCRHAIYRYADAHPALVHSSEAYAGDLRAFAKVDPADVPPPDSAARSEALAARLRAFATPPPAIGSAPAATDRGAPPPAAIPAPAPAPGPGGPTTSSRPAPSAPAPPAAAEPPAPAAGSAPPLPNALPDPLLAHCP